MQQISLMELRFMRITFPDLYEFSIDAQNVSKIEEKDSPVHK